MTTPLVGMVSLVEVAINWIILASVIFVLSLLVLAAVAWSVRVLVREVRKALNGRRIR